MGSGIPIIFKTTMNISITENTSLLMNISSIMLSTVYFIIGLSIVSYGISILSVGQSLMFLIFKKLSDDDEVILRSDEDDNREDLIIQKKFESNLKNFSTNNTDQEK